jgi:hypothetical protein
MHRARRLLLAALMLLAGAVPGAAEPSYHRVAAAVCIAASLERSD